MKIKDYIPQSLINIYHLFVALIFNFIYGFPSRKLKIIGVTGTDGKTTTASLIYAILKEAGYNAGLVTSISAKIGDREEDTGFHVTSPDPSKLQKFLKKMVAAGCEYAVLEVTSHGLDQHRFSGVKFNIGVLTNISHEHLDYHENIENYIRTKAKLFKKSKYSILNNDDPSVNKIINVALDKIVLYSIKSEADIKPKKIESSKEGQTILLDGYGVKTKLLGRYNVYNILAAIATVTFLGIPEKEIKRAIASFEPLIGRFEIIDEGQDFTVIVDFAHTPKALEEVLKLCREITDTVIVVFGCAGLRDVEKRPKMGEIACNLADFVVLTAEDPRTENVNDIIDQIVSGCKKAGGVEAETLFKVPDRKDAINFAIKKLAKKGDLVLITGKGHEKSMCFGTTEHPWSDQNVVKDTLQNFSDR